jgi:hypothetical protein
MTTLTGSCLCGDTTYALDGPFLSMLHCHCSMCRKHHGSAFLTELAAPASAFRWLQGAEQLARYTSSPGYARTFCPRCGSTMPMEAPNETPKVDGSDVIFVPAGNLDGDPQVAPRMHIFAGSKAPWYRITDGLPQHETVPPGYDPPVIEQPAAPANPSADTCRGSCLCGRVSFRFTGRPQAMRNCHCTRCRRGRAAAHATNLFVSRDQFEWRSGEHNVQVFDLPGAERFGINFCGDCGSCAPRLSSVAGWNIPAGSLDDDPGVAPDNHIFVGSKAPWFEISDSLVQHEAYG